MRENDNPMGAGKAPEPGEAAEIGSAGVAATSAEPHLPPMPDHIREAARMAPDHWIGMVDPGWAGEGPPPRWAVAGEWRSGPTGEAEEWRENDAYRPSPKVLDLPEPADDVDAAVQLAATGYGPADDVLQRLAAAEVAVLRGPDGGPMTSTLTDGTPVVPVFTSDLYRRPLGALGYMLLAVQDLVEQLPDGHRLYLNPSAPVSMLVETEPLQQTITEAQQAPQASESEEAVDEAAQSILTMSAAP
ncbi:type VII secretion system-associated protein [Streptomyces sp. NPDC056707]|uniref:type VII secretion system-associated protein n=1 Tax=Streptomyces sp. NPDC056707 TaxID=3345919 RepID=UPI0036AF5458